MNIEYKLYRPGELDASIIHAFLIEMDDYLIPTLSSRVDLGAFATKISNLATHYVAYDGKSLIGLCSFYFNYSPHCSYGTYVCTHPNYRDEMVGVELLQKFIEYCRLNGSKGVEAVIRKSNKALVKFYSAMGFSIVGEENYPNSDIVELHIEKTF